MSSTKTRFGQVVSFNRDVLGIGPRVLGMQPPEEAALSYTQLIEEAREYQEAIGRVNFIDCADAIIDNLYFSYGILYKMGLDERLVNRLFDAVHEANMTKAKGVKAGREGFDAADARKPEDWVDPKDKFREILNDYNNIYNN